MRDTAQQNCGQQNQKVSPGRTVLTNLYKSQCEGRRDVRKVRYMEERKVEKMEMVHILLWTWGRWWGQPQRLKGEGETKAQRTELFFFFFFRKVGLLFSCSVVSDCLWPHGLQHARLPCPSPSPRVHSDSCALSQRCHLTILSSVTPFSSCLQPFPASENAFPVSQLFTSSSQNWSFSFGISPSREYSGLIPFRIDSLDLLAVQGTC